MAIIIHTGLPGHGKTLYTLHEVRRWAEKEGRTVFYSGIPELTIPGWVELEDATKWHECPPHSIVVIDEAQKVFRPRGNGSAVPAHVSAAETHRHGGIDAVLITQHPLLIDGNIRRLADKHRHIIRAFGSPYATVHEWPQVMDQPQKVGSRKDSIKTQFRYPREVYSWYKSAEAHTYKTKIPAKVWAVLGLFVALGVGGYQVFNWIKGGAMLGSDSQVATAVDAVAPGAATNTVRVSERRQVRAQKTTAEWLQEQQPRVGGMPHTAPLYDRITEPVRAPFPAACYEAKSTGCRCYTDQATRIDVQLEVCRAIVKGGFYVAWEIKQPAGQAKREPAGQPEPPADAVTAAGPSELFAYRQ